MPMPKCQEGDAAVPLIDTTSPAARRRRQYSTSFQQPGESSEPMLPSAVESLAVYPDASTPGRTTGAAAIDEPPAAVAAPAATRTAGRASSVTAARCIRPTIGR